MAWNRRDGQNMLREAGVVRGRARQRCVMKAQRVMSSVVRKLAGDGHGWAETRPDGQGGAKVSLGV